VRQDGSEMFLVTNESEAVLAIDSLASAHQKELANEWTKVYREDLNDGKKVVISTRQLGRIVDGSIIVDTILDCIKVPIAHVIKPRLEKSAVDIPIYDIIDDCEEDFVEEEEVYFDDGTSDDECDEDQDEE
jgi:hypothetical protein